MPKKLETVSVCMIVKDEASYIEGCIKSALPIVDELIVVDTGSVDGTTEIARSYGARIIKHKWQDSFSDARNVYINNAAMDWIFVLDADERIDAENLSRLKEIISGEYNCMGLSFILRNYSNDTTTLGWTPCEANNPFSDKFSGWYPTRSIRLFKKHKDIYYSRAVHESVKESIKNINGKILDLDISIHHIGDTRGTMNKSSKMEMYARLGKKQIQLYPKDAQAYFELGRIYRERGEYEMAESLLTQANEIDEGYPQVHNELGAVYLKQERFNDAMIAFKRAVLLDPTFADSHYNLGNLYDRLNEHEKAAESYRKAIENNPKFANAYNNLGLVLDEMGKIQEAVGVYHKALEINPNLALSYNNLGISLLKLLKPFEAIDSFKKAIELNNAYYKAHYNLGNTYVRVKNYDEAIRLYHRCIEIDSEIPEPFFNLGAIYAFELNDNGNAMKYWKRYLKLKPDSPEAMAIIKSLGITLN